MRSTSSWDVAHDECPGLDSNLGPGTLRRALQLGTAIIPFINALMVVQFTHIFHLHSKEISFLNSFSGCTTETFKVVYFHSESDLL